MSSKDLEDLHLSDDNMTKHVDLVERYKAYVKIDNTHAGLTVLLGRLRLGAPAAGVPPMLTYEEDLMDFFTANHIANSSVYMKVLGLLMTKDIACFWVIGDGKLR